MQTNTYTDAFLSLQTLFIPRMSGKLMEEQNPRLTTDSSAVYQRFISETRSALSSWLPTCVTTPFCLCKPFSGKACPEISFSDRSVHIGLRLFVLPKRCSRQVSSVRWEQEGGLSSGRIDPTSSRSTQLRPFSPPRRAPPRPNRLVVCSDFRFNKYVLEKTI